MSHSHQGHHFEEQTYSNLRFKNTIFLNQNRKGLRGSSFNLALCYINGKFVLWSIFNNTKKARLLISKLIYVKRNLRFKSLIASTFGTVIVTNKGYITTNHTNVSKIATRDGLSTLLNDTQILFLTKLTTYI